jgi:glycosyltransferase involved in cell wall biosynthesis
MIKDRGWQDKVLLTGGMPSTDPRLIGLLQLATVLLLPSLSETFGLVLLEAWAAGTMVISSRTSGGSALIEDGRNGWLFDVDQPETFHRALDRTLADPDGRSEMARLGGEMVRDRYNVKAITRGVKDIYQQLIKKHQCIT